MAKSRSKEPMSGLELTEEVFQLLREAPRRAILMYLVGALPFVAALLFYWADMARSAFAYSHHAQGAVTLTLLFGWMKMWQAAYARDLMAYARGQEPPEFRVRDLAQSGLRQMALQVWGLFLIPLSLMAIVPFGQVYARYQNLTVLDGSTGDDLGALSSRSSELARLWPRQNWTVIWALSPMLMIVAAAMFLVIMPVMKVISPDWTYAMMILYASVFLVVLMPLSPFGTAVAANVAMFIMMLPGLLHSLLGIQSIFVQSPAGMINSIFYAVVLAVTYLCLDPCVKAAYVLRCFYGDSASTGEDLRVELRRWARGGAAVAVLLLLFAAAPARAQEGESPKAQAQAGQPGEKGATVDPAQLDRAISSELQDRAYAYRLPRVRPEQEKGPVSQFMGGIFETLREWWDALGRALGRLARWLKNLLPEPDYHPSRPTMDVRGALTWVMYFIIAVLLCVAAVFAYRLWQRRGGDTEEFAAEPVEQAPDLEDEDLTADALPESDWVSLARELMAKGETRLALRAWFLAGISRLDGMGMIAVARFKSNRDYREKVARRAHVAPVLLEAFADNVSVFEEVWYGDHGADAAKLERVAGNYRRMADHG